MTPRPPLPQRTVWAYAVLIIGAGAFIAVFVVMEGVGATESVSECHKGAEWHYRALMDPEADVEYHWSAAKSLEALEDFGGDCSGWDEWVP